MSKIKVGIAGLGRSGWDIHVQALRPLSEQFQIVAAMDFSDERRAQAATEFGAHTTADFAELCANPDVELLVVATPNRFHKEHVIAALQAGKHVVCEKPFGLSAGEADEMIAAAQTAEKHVVPFQNRRFEPHFVKVKEIIESGILGDIHFIRIAAHGFSRRWDWQTLREFGGGQLLNTGPHFVDHATQLLGGSLDEIPEVWADLKTVLASGDAEDHVKIVMKGSSGPTIDFELSSACAFPQDHWLVMGNRGGLHGTTRHLEWKWVDWSQMPDRPVDREPTEGRSYNRETLEWQTDSCDCAENFGELARNFYLQLANALRKGGEVPVTPQSIRKQMAVIEKAKELTGF